VPCLSWGAEVSAVPIGKHGWAWTILGLAAAFALTEFAIVQITERLEERYPLTSFERSRDAEQIVSLRSYAARRRLGSFLPPEDAQISLREALLQSILARSLPIRQTFENGRYVARLDRARLDLQEGLASITLLGHGTMTGEGASPLEADLELQTHIDVVEFRPDVGTLRAGLAVTGVHVIRAGGKGRNGFLWNPVARYFSGLKGEDWNNQRLTIDIPIRLEREITLPPIVGELNVAERKVPLDIAVSSVTVHRDRLLLSLAVRLGGRGNPAVGDTSSTRANAGWLAEHPAAEKQDMETLYLKGIAPGDRERLLDDIEDLASRDPLMQGLENSDRDVVVVVPRHLLQRICDELSRSYVREARLDFNPHVTTGFHDQVKGKVLGHAVGAGQFDGVVHVEHVQGRLRMAGDPKLSLHAPDRLELATPIQVVQGSGRARVAVKWSPGFFTAVVCRGFEFQSNLAGNVLPFSHLMTTDIRVVALAEGIVGVPAVRRDRFMIPCEFTPASMETVRAAIRNEDRLLRCGLVMNADTMFAKVERVVRGKVRIRLPVAIFKPFALPVALDKSYDAGDFHIVARATDPEIAVREGYLRIGFNADLAVRPATPSKNAAAAGAPPSTATATPSAAAYRITTSRLDKLFPSAASSL